MKKLATFVVWGDIPAMTEAGQLVGGNERKPLEVFLDVKAADEFLLGGLVQAMQVHAGVLAYGGTVSLIINRGRKPSDEEPLPPCTNGSFAISNPGENGKSNRHVWDFQVERRMSVPVEQPL